MLGWTLGLLTGRSANLVRAGSHADTGRMGTAKVWGVGEDTSEGRGPGGKLDDSWLKLNRKVGRKAGHATKTGWETGGKGQERAMDAHTHTHTNVHQLHYCREPMRLISFADVSFQMSN